MSNYEKIAEGGNGASGFTFRNVGQAIVNSSGRVAFSDVQFGTGLYSTPGANIACTTILDPAASGKNNLTLDGMNASGTIVFSINDTPSN